jgi:hypothetical protein
VGAVQAKGEVIDCAAVGSEFVEEEYYKRLVSE